MSVRIVLADGGVEFDGATMELRPLGGVETAVVCLTRELARRGHRVMVRNNCARPMVHDGVDGARLSDARRRGLGAVRHWRPVMRR